MLFLDVSSHESNISNFEDNPAATPSIAVGHEKKSTLRSL